MSGEWVLLVGGAVLLVAALFAAAYRARASDPGRTAGIAGVTAASGGALCVIAALILIAGGGSTARSGSVRVSIGDELSEGQVSEEIRIVLDDRDVGVLHVDRRSPKAQVTVTLARKGRFRYRLDSTRVLKGKPPERRTSSGQVVIESSRPLMLYVDERGGIHLM
jgi:hypothetical protein